MEEQETTGKKDIIFIHPDLGIGGAERLVVDAAVGLQKLGHTVTIYTSHCDRSHCFDEAKDGTLDVQVLGNTIFPANVLGRFAILCAILRQLHLTVLLLFVIGPPPCDYVFIDQLSTCIPLLRFYMPHVRILFYCHFPDKLLAIRSSALKSLYRVPFDYIEGVTTGSADTIVVNSKFTASVFRDAFPRIDIVPKVVYPCVDTDTPATAGIDGDKYQFLNGEERKIILSINRFERKKNIGLAIEAFAGLAPEERKSARLVIAGGHDPRVQENVSYHAELVSLAESLDLKSITCNNFITSLSIPADIEVLFLLSIPSKLKTFLLNTASLLVYTPTNEHFGIVPLEAMLAGTPVLATNTGGPLETVQDGITGWLRPSVPSQWTAVIHTALNLTDAEKTALSTCAKTRVIEDFSKDKMALNLEEEFTLIATKKRNSPVVGLLGIVTVVAMWGGVCAYIGLKLLR